MGRISQRVEDWLVVTVSTNTTSDDADSTAVYAIGASNSQFSFACILDLTCIAMPCILLCLLLETVGCWPPHVIQPKCWLRPIQSEKCCQHQRYSHFDLFRHVL